MKKCQNCGYECDDTDKVCCMCGTKLNKDIVADNNINIQYNQNKQQSSNGSIFKADKSTQKSPFSDLQSYTNKGYSILNSSWIIISFIPFINGFGMIYAGKKTSIKSWILEGVLYEMPVIINLLFPSIFTFSLIILSVIISIIRSIMIINRYKIILNKGNYKKSNHKIISLFLFISSFIPFFNGIGFIYYGNKYSKPYFALGIIFEMVWVMGIILLNMLPISFNTIGTFAGVAMTSLLLSGMSMISFNYDCEALSHHVNNSPIKTRRIDKGYDKELNSYYKNQLDSLKEVFDAKEKKVRKLITQHFGTGNITSNRFLAAIDNSHENAYRQLDSGYDLIKYTSEPSKQVEEELVERINILNSINDEIEKLTVELILNMHEDEKSDENLKNLVNEMEDLRNDVNKYE